MPKKTSASAIRAQDLIASRAGIGTTPPPSAEAVRELKLLCAYNDGVGGSTGRVSAAAAIAMLRSHGWKGSCRSALNHVCQKLGRTSYGTP